MAINGKYVQDCMQKALKLSMNFCWTCVKTHPYVSSTLIFLLLLYLCLPSVFWFMTYLAAFISLAASIFKIYFCFNNNAKTCVRDDDDGKNNVAKSTTITRRKLVRSDVHARSVRRRKPIETSRDDSSLQTSEEEKSTVCSSSVNNVTVDKSALIEEHPKEIREVEVDSVISRGECSIPSFSRGLRPKFHHESFQGSKKLNAGDSESPESTEDEDDERDKEENTKAVQWSEDDQKNLMDLGLSEIERNKRLESLIARRRARKLLSLHVRRSLLNMDKNAAFGRINPITVPKHNTFPANPPSGQFSPVPGSAPPVLIPMHNPFDLPYDPQEEKPILTGGSFHQEFLPVLQKDMLCRHESFNLGPFFPGESKQDQQEASQFHGAATKQRSFDGYENSKLENQIDQEDTDKIIEVESSQPSKHNSDIVTDYVRIPEDVQGPEIGLESIDSHQEKDTGEVETKLMLVDDSSCMSSSSSSSEQDEPFSFSRINRELILESLASTIPRNISVNRDSRSDMDYGLNGSGDLSIFDKNKLERRFSFPHRAIHHIPAFSIIASDLQVEASQIRSPRLTIDEEVPLRKGKMERGISENIRAASSHPSCGVDENESRLRDIHEVGNNSANEVGFSGTPSSEASKMVEEGANIISQSILDAELPDGSQDQASVLETEPQLTGELMSHHTQNGEPDNPEQPSRSLEDSQGEFYNTSNANNSSILQKFDTKDLILEEKGNGADLLTRDGGRKQKEWSMASSPTSTGYPESQCDIVEVHRNILEYYQPVVENNNPKASQEFLGESINMAQHEKPDDSMQVVKEHDTQEPIQDNEHEQHITEKVFPESNGSFSNQQVSRLHPQFMVQQKIPIASFVSASPRSVLQPKFSISKRSLANYSEESHAGIQQFDRQNTESNVLNEPRGESLISNEPLSTALSMDDSASNGSQDTDAEISQESSNPLTSSTMETKVTEQITEDNTESLTTPESTAGLLKQAGETSPRILEENDERYKELDEHEYGGISKTSDSIQTLMEAISDATEVEKQHLPLPKPDDVNKAFEAGTGIDTADEIKEVDRAKEAEQHISPRDGSVSVETQEELLKSPGTFSEDTGQSK